MDRPLEKEVFVKVGRGDLDRLTTEVMQLREFLPRMVNDLVDTLHKTSNTERVSDHVSQEQNRLRQQCLHLGSRLDSAETERQREREEKLLLKAELWACREQLQQQAEFCRGLGAASCTVLWSASGREDAVRDMLADGKLPSFLDLAGQTLQSFVQSGEDVSTPGPLDQTSTEHQFVLALAGIITNVAAVPCGRDFLSSSGHGLLGTLMQLLEPRKPGALPRLKVLMLMALYNVSISVRGLKYISQSPGLLPMVWTLLEDQDPDVCLHSLRLLQSLLLEEEVETTMGAALLTSPCLEHVCRLTSSQQPALKQTACDTLEDIQALFCKLGKPDRQSSFQQETKTPVRTLP
ncbi:heat shock factor 2-binding protein isoform X2 [Gadus macrocephalus]|uniref:heat shock factor 2-binding protein isoform X2 n=1 Tax=Gadus macrocephalus TaxID=80720 RepID=UPI0028CB6970|nr:heat shock factor 2-binding protein isoform X2 [Gadus macrocephalus]